MQSEEFGYTNAASQAADQQQMADGSQAEAGLPPPPRRRQQRSQFGNPRFNLFGGPDEEAEASGQGSSSSAVDYSEIIAAAQKMVAAANAAGENLSFSDAITIASQMRAQQAMTQAQARPFQPAARTTRPLEERLASVEKTLPIFDGSQNIYDFIAKLDTKFIQHGVTGELAKLQLLQSKLQGGAFTAVRLNIGSCLTYTDAVNFLKETYAPSIAGVKASLIAMKFNARTETVRDFNRRFDLVAGAAPTASISQSDMKQFYLKALGKGDVALMRDTIWSVDIEGSSLAQIQKSVVKKLDNFTVLAADTAVGGANSLSAAYQGPQTADDASEVASTAASTISKLLQSAQEGRREAPPSTAPRAQTAPEASVAPRPANKRACYVCGSTEHLANQCPKRKKEMISKAVGYVLEHLDAESQAPQQATPIGVVGAIMPTYAVQTLEECKKATSFAQQGKALVGFAGALAQYCFANPDDLRAAHYMQRVEALGDAALDEMMAAGESPLANKILASTRSQRGVNVGTQAGGDKGVAADLWPGITDVLGALPAKTNVFEWLKESERFCKSVVELAMEIALDNNWKHDYDRMKEELVRARGTRKFGEYVADTRAKARLHTSEQSRIVAGKVTARAYGVGEADSDTAEHMEALTLFSFEAARAKLESDFGPVEDFTSLAGPPTPHQIMQVVLGIGGRQIKVTAIRDTGSPDTIITKGLYAQITSAQPQGTTKDFSGLGGSAQRFLGIMKPLTIRLTPRIQVEHAAYISPDRYCLLILGNDLFNKEVVETVSQHDGYGMLCLRYGDTVDVLPYRMMTQKERQERERAFKETEKPTTVAFTTPPASYEQAAELMIASQAARSAIQESTPVPDAFHGAVMERMQMALDQVPPGEESESDDEVAYAAAVLAEQHFLGL